MHTLKGTPTGNTIIYGNTFDYVYDIETVYGWMCKNHTLESERV